MANHTNDDRVSISISDGVADVRMVRADKRNALDGAMFAALAAAGERLIVEPGLRAVVLSGEGASFCAGLDLETMAEFAAVDTEKGSVEGRDNTPGALSARGITHLAQQICWVWQEVPVPVIAAVHGHALGGGIQLALGADIRIVHPNTKLSVRETYWGLIPDMTGTLMLANLVGADVAKELVFTARIFDGGEAHRLGLATRLSETPHADAIALAREIADRSPSAIRGAKSLLNGLFNARAAEQFASERRVIYSLIGGQNQRETVMANLEGRPPVFEDPAPGAIPGGATASGAPEAR